MSWIRSRVSPSLASRTTRTRSRRPGNEAVVADAQQRPAGHVADAGRLDDDRPGPAAREAVDTSRARSA